MEETVRYSKKDISRQISIPSIFDEDIAYLIGLLVGDGSLVDGSKNNHSYRVSLYGHATEDKEWYEKEVSTLFKKIFNIIPKIRICTKKEKKDTWIELYFHSLAVSTFLHKVVGLPYGKKKEMSIPPVIKQSKTIIKRSFLRGLADTDFCLTFKRRNKDIQYYPVVSYGTPDKTLITEIYFLLTQLGFRMTLSFNVKSRRENKIHMTNRLDINGTTMLEKWMEKVGFSSRKHLRRFDIWKRQGYYS